MTSPETLGRMDRTNDAPSMRQQSASGSASQNVTADALGRLLQNPEFTLLDAHFHLGFTNNPLSTAAHARERGIACLCCTVTPAEFERLAPQLADAGNIALGIGLHPWWVPQDGNALLEQLDAFRTMLPQADFVGEVGLDYAPRHVETAGEQRAALRQILTACAAAGSLAISMHCVRAYDDALGLIRETHVADTCRVIFHWFSGDGNDLRRAIDLGCYFSVGPRMLATKRGRGLASQIPRDRLLIETDAPYVDAQAPDFKPVDFDVALWEQELMRARDLCPHMS